MPISVGDIVMVDCGSGKICQYCGMVEVVKVDTFYVNGYLLNTGELVLNQLSWVKEILYKMPVNSG